MPKFMEQNICLQHPENQHLFIYRQRKAWIYNGYKTTQLKGLRYFTGSLYNLRDIYSAYTLVGHKRSHSHTVSAQITRNLCFGSSPTKIEHFLILPGSVSFTYLQSITIKLTNDILRSFLLCPLSSFVIEGNRHHIVGFWTLLLLYFDRKRLSVGKPQIINHWNTKLCW